MGIFRRRALASRSGSREAAAITGFWTWWQAEGSQAMAVAITAGEPERTVGPLSRQVRAVHPDLAWELAPGAAAAHLLVVSAEGNPAVRGLARRWRRAAPAADPIWEYSDSRPPATDPEQVVLTLGATVIDTRSATVGARVRGADLDLAVYHPAFAILADDERLRATFLLLDTVLGEAAVETWIGTVETAIEEPIDQVPLSRLRSVVGELTERFTDEQGEPAWMLMEGLTGEGIRVMASAQIPLRVAFAPELDTYVEVVVAFQHHTPEGLPDDDSLGPLRDLEQHLNSRLGGSGRVVAHETQSGVRTLHAYVDGSTPAVEQIRAAVVGWDQGDIEVNSKPDPGWHFVQHLRG